MNARPAPNPCASGNTPLRSDFAHLIDGEMVAGKEWFDVINPATGQAFARAPQLTRAPRSDSMGYMEPRVISVLKG